MLLIRPEIDNLQPGTLFRLRWRYEYHNRPAAYGQWDRPHDDVKDMTSYAAFKTKEGLARAIIEGKDVLTKDEKPLVECLGQDFCLFKWVAAAVCPGMFKGTIRPRHMLWGLQLVDRDSAWTVFPSGEVWRKARTEEDKQYHYAGYGR